MNGGPPEWRAVTIYIGLYRYYMELTKVDSVNDLGVRFDSKLAFRVI